MSRGRPPGQLTPRRAQVLAVIDAAALLGVRLTTWDIAIAVGVPDYRNVKRICREIEHKRGRDETETDYTSRAIRTLKAFARNYDVAVIIVAHPAKPDTTRKLSPPGLYSISGSAHWANKPDYGLCVHQSDPDPDSVKRDVIVSKVRMGLPGRKGIVTLGYDRRSSSYFKAHSMGKGC